MNPEVVVWYTLLSFAVTFSSNYFSYILTILLEYLSVATFGCKQFYVAIKFKIFNTINERET